MADEPITHDREPEFHIQIDRHEYTVHFQEMTGEQLRHVPPTPIPQDRDLYEVVPGEEDRQIQDDQTVTIRNGLRFFTAPRHINPGAALRLGV